MEAIIPAMENTFVAVDEETIRHPGRIRPGSGDFVTGMEKLGCGGFFNHKFADQICLC